MKIENCRHGSIVTYAISDGGDERMWACADCLIRFYPACPRCVDIGHRNEKHVPPAIDEERLARALHAYYHDGFPFYDHDEGTVYCREDAAAIAKAYREDTDAHD